MSESTSNESLLNQNYFELLKLPITFKLDCDLLDKNYRLLAAQVHPDRFVNASLAEKHQSLILASYINSAYRTLKKPIERASYLLSLAGVNTKEENNTFMPEDFLSSQIEWRESIGEAALDSNIELLESLSRKLTEEIILLENNFAESFEQKKDFNNASLRVRKWYFLLKLEEQITDALEGLLG